ncbi:MAG: hypothetical protein Q8N88_05165, partial [Nanoarchaeota archaeon]|nr:hypothetical protein [Nanoarchaeota archaeon]
LKFKYTPKKGNRFEYKDGLGVGFRSLEKKVAGIISVFSLVGAILLFSGNLTGSVVGNLANSTANVVGASLIIVGLMAGYFLIRK